jgi:hypothetical protein
MFMKLYPSSITIRSGFAWTRCFLETSGEYCIFSATFAGTVDLSVLRDHDCERTHYAAERGSGRVGQSLVDDTCVVVDNAPAAGPDQILSPNEGSSESMQLKNRRLWPTRSFA